MPVHITIEAMHRRSAAFGFALSIAAVVGAPALVVGVAFLAHALSYRGMCGPYPTDIPAFRCGLGEYLVNFAEPFALVGLAVLAIAATFVAALLVSLAWLVWGIAQVLRR